MWRACALRDVELTVPALVVKTLRCVLEMCGVDLWWRSCVACSCGVWTECIQPADSVVSGHVCCAGWSAGKLVGGVGGRASCCAAASSRSPDLHLALPAPFTAFRHSLAHRLSIYFRLLGVMERVDARMQTAHRAAR